MVKIRTEMYENKIKRLKDYYSGEIQERDEKLAVIYLIYLNYVPINLILKFHRFYSQTRLT